MDDAIDQIKRGHTLILDSITLISPLARNYPAAKPLLRQFYERVLNHCGQQSAEFYSKLRAACSHDRASEKMVEFLSHNLKELKIKTLQFMDDFPADLGDIHPVNFPIRFSEYSSEWEARVQFEREYLILLLKNR